MLKCACDARGESKCTEIQCLKGRFKAASKVTECVFKGDHLVGGPLIKHFSLKTRQ